MIVVNLLFLFFNVFALSVMVWSYNSNEGAQTKMEQS